MSVPPFSVCLCLSPCSSLSMGVQHLSTLQFLSSDFRPFLVIESPSPSPHSLFSKYSKLSTTTVEPYRKACMCTETNPLFLLYLSLHFLLPVLFPFLPFFFPMWQSKQEPLTWISVSCSCYTKSCFEVRKSPILSTVQRSFLSSFFCSSPLCHPSPSSSCHVFPLSKSLTLF